MKLTGYLTCLALVCLTLAGWTPTVRAADDTRPPNLVVFLIDDLGWTDLS